MTTGWNLTWKVKYKYLVDQNMALVSLADNLFAVGLTLGLVVELVFSSELRCPTELVDRVDCYPEGSPSQAACSSRGCCWSFTDNERGPPPCFFPTYYGYESQVVPVKDGNSWSIFLRRIKTPSLFGTDVENIAVLIEEQTRNRLRIKVIKTLDLYQVILRCFTVGLGAYMSSTRVRLLTKSVYAYREDICWPLFKMLE